MNKQHESALHFNLIAEAIRFIRDQQKEQPDLCQVAAHLGVSESHCQRLFSDWVGVSPKRFLQYLTKTHAKSLLLKSQSVLEASFDSGLSSAGRLHDLMVTCDAMTPGEIKAQGAHLSIKYGFGWTPFGQALVAWTERGICHFTFVNEDVSEAINELFSEWPRAIFNEDAEQALQWCARIFIKSKVNEPLHILLKGTNFQIKVWEALLKVKAGQLVSYKQLAEIAGQPNASRAVGSAMAANKIGYLIPCHRVIRESGDFSHYRWSPERKAALHIWEQAGEQDNLL